VIDELSLLFPYWEQSPGRVHPLGDFEDQLIGPIDSVFTDVAADHPLPHGPVVTLHGTV